MICGLTLAAVTGAIMKLLSEQLHPVQITWFRFLGFTLILFPVVAIRIGSSALRPGRPWMQVVRGLTMSSATVAFVVGARTVDYADAIAILYAYPFLLTVLAAWFLGEKVRPVGWLGVTGGFLGVLLVMQPEFETINTGTLFVFLCAVIVSIQMAMNRKLGSVSHPLATIIWGAVVATVSLSLIVPWFWQPVNAAQWGLLLLMVLTGAVNQTCLVYGFAYAEASTLAPFTYLEIVAAVVVGLIVFGTLPTWLSWIGIGLVIACGLLVAFSLRHPPGPTGKTRVA